MSKMYNEERMCELCSKYIFDGYVNTNQYNLCEGSQCELAEELLEEELQNEKIEKRENAINTILKNKN